MFAQNRLCIDILLKVNDHIIDVDGLLIASHQAVADGNQESLDCKLRQVFLRSKIYTLYFKDSGITLLCS